MTWQEHREPKTSDRLSVAPAILRRPRPFRIAGIVAVALLLIPTLRVRGVQRYVIPNIRLLRSVFRVVPTEVIPQERRAVEDLNL